MAAPGPPHGISWHDATKFRRPKSNFVAQPRNWWPDRTGATSPRNPRLVWVSPRGALLARRTPGQNSARSGPRPSNGPSTPIALISILTGLRAKVDADAASWREDCD